MPVIAMNQEMGSGGKEVAEALAAELGLALVRQEVYEHVAGKMQVKKSLVRRVMEGKAGFLDRWNTEMEDVSLYTAEGVLELAARGNILIRGWGATYSLRQVPHVLGVRVCAPLALRTQRVMERLQTDDEDFVREEIERSDATHAANLKSRFGITWGDPMIYDLVLNTERLSTDSCVQMIKDTLKRPEFQETNESLGRLQNLALEARVRGALRADEATEEVKVMISADAGAIKLSGIVINDAELSEVKRVVSRVPGVREVTSEVRLLSDAKRFPVSRY